MTGSPWKPRREGVQALRGRKTLPWEGSLWRCAVRWWGGGTRIKQGVGGVSREGEGRYWEGL